MHEHRLEKQVDFLPPFIYDLDLAAFFNEISVFCHANNTGENFELVIAEAMAAGLPVITHPVERLQDNAQIKQVEHGETGFVVNDAEKYAQAVLWLLDNPGEARRMGLAGREKAGKEYHRP